MLSQMITDDKELYLRVLRYEVSLTDRFRIVCHS